MWFRMVVFWAVGITGLRLTGAGETLLLGVVVGCKVALAPGGAETGGLEVLK